MTAAEQVVRPSEHERLTVGMDHAYAVARHLADLRVVSVDVNPYHVSVQVSTATQARVLARRLGGDWEDRSTDTFVKLKAREPLGPSEWASYDRPVVSVTAYLGGQAS